LPSVRQSYTTPQIGSQAGLTNCLIITPLRKKVIDEHFTDNHEAGEDFLSELASTSKVITSYTYVATVKPTSMETIMVFGWRCRFLSSERCALSEMNLPRNYVPCEHTKRLAIHEQRHLATCNAASLSGKFSYQARHSLLMIALYVSLRAAGVLTKVEGPVHSVDGKKRIDFVCVMSGGTKVAIDVTMRSRRRVGNAGRIETLELVERQAIAAKNKQYPGALLAHHRVRELVTFLVTPTGEVGAQAHKLYIYCVYNAMQTALWWLIAWSIDGYPQWS